MRLRVPPHRRHLPASLAAGRATPSFCSSSSSPSSSSLRPLSRPPPRASLFLRLLELRILLALDGIIYRKKNNEIRIIYHRGRFPPHFAKFTFKLLRRYFPFRSRSLSRSLACSLGAFARAKDNMLSPFRYRALVESPPCASSYLGTNGRQPPEGVLLTWRPRRPSRVVGAMRFSLLSPCSTRVILCAFIPRPTETPLLLALRV